MATKLIYRSMREDWDRRPVLSSTSSRGLGVRPDYDIPIREDGAVEPETEGMSVSPDSVLNLSEQRLPREFGGDGKDPAWEFSVDDLPEALVYRHDDRPNREGKPHGFLEPAFSMLFEDYEAAIQETRDLWRICRHDVE